MEKIQTQCVADYSNIGTNRLFDFIVTLFLGMLGIHKFMKKDTFMGIAYLLTFGLFGIGWLYDTIKAFINLFNRKDK